MVNGGKHLKSAFALDWCVFPEERGLVDSRATESLGQNQMANPLIRHSHLHINWRGRRWWCGAGWGVGSVAAGMAGIRDEATREEGGNPHARGATPTAQPLDI